MNLDEQLLERNNEEDQEEMEDEESAAGRAGDLNQARREPANSDNSNNGSDFNSLRHQAQVNKVKKDKEKEKKGSSAGSGSPIMASTNELLKNSWLHLIDSWGLTLVWIDIHIFLRKILGKKLFGPLGGEWLAITFHADGSQKTTGDSKMLKIVEPIGSGCCNLGCLLIVISLLALVAMIVDAVNNPISTLTSLGLSAIRKFFTGN